jgi:hypothetical protein
MARRASSNGAAGEELSVLREQRNCQRSDDEKVVTCSQAGGLGGKALTKRPRPRREHPKCDRELQVLGQGGR